LAGEGLNRALLSTRAIADAVETLSAFCSTVEQESDSPDLRRAARDRLRLLGDLSALVDYAFLHEGRSPLTDLAPEAEILRRPSGSSEEFSKRPIFLLGSRRCGTTLVLHLINAGTEIAALPESFIAAALAQCDVLFQTGLAVKKVLDEPFPRYMRRLGQIADRIYLDFAVRNGKRRWASKEGCAWSRLDTLDALFDYRSKFVYVVRHGFDAAWSSATRFPMKDGLPRGRTGLSVATYLDEWVTWNEATLDFVDRNRGRALVVRYEELTTQPDVWGPRLFEFVEQEWSVDVWSRMQTQRLGQMGDNKIFKTRGKILRPAPPAWSDWPQALKEQLGRRANPTLVRLGYDPVV